MTLPDLIARLESPLCACRLPKPVGVVECDACYHAKYIETKKPGSQVACERLDQWEERT